MSSEGVTKVNLEKHTPSKVTEDKNSELDKEDFQKAAQDAKDGVANTLQSAKEFVVGESNDAEQKTKPSKVGNKLDCLPALMLVLNSDDHHHSCTRAKERLCCCVRAATVTTLCKAFLMT